MSFNNVKGSLDGHDFVYGWEDMLTGCGLEIPNSVQVRKDLLQELKSKWIEASDS
ncbi:hypothetical protein F7C95_00330 [Opitutia bacterium ISCC 51]|nr:hypothetical protein F7C95_00330 [Opitutae bacterium ISCC 51]QXD28466.1 hypothetical protein GA003_00325 [Opitutae bacterium ISCC 52]